MAKNIFMISPFEVLTGNLSGKQDLKYPSNDNKAYEAPEGRQYARNYRTRYIGCRRAKDGKAFFLVKKASATKVSASTKLNMALLGATQAIWANIKSDNTIMGKIGPSYELAVAQGSTSMSLENWAKDIIRRGLLGKTQYFNFTPQTGAGVGVATNPFNAPETPQSGAHVTSIKNSVLVEFWGVLGFNAIYFYVGGRKCIAHTGDTFNNVRLAGDTLNPGLRIQVDAAEQNVVVYTTEAEDNVWYGYNLMNGDTMVLNTDSVASIKYSLGEYGPHDEH